MKRWNVSRSKCLMQLPIIVVRGCVRCGRCEPHQDAGVISLDLIEVILVTEMREGIPAVSYEGDHVLWRHGASVLKTLQLSRIEDEDRKGVAVRLGAELLSTLTRGIPTVDGCHQDVTVREEVRHSLHGGASLLAVRVPGSVVHDEGVLELSCILESSEHISPPIIFDQTVFVEESGWWWSCSLLGDAGIADDTDHRVENCHKENGVLEHLKDESGPGSGRFTIWFIFLLILVCILLSGLTKPIHPHPLGSTQAFLLL